MENVLRVGEIKSWAVCRSSREYDTYEVTYTVRLIEDVDIHGDEPTTYTVEGEDDDSTIHEWFDNLADASAYFEGVCDDC